MDLIAGARALVVASRCYETFGLVVVEAFAHGVPAIAPSLGIFPDLVQDGRTGLLFAPGEASDLRNKLLELAAPARSVQMGEEARRLYEAVYTPERNLTTLLGIYREAIGQPPAV